MPKCVSSLTLYEFASHQDPPLVLQNSQSWLSSVLSNLQSEPFMRVELVLRLFYMLREVVTNKVWTNIMCINYVQQS